MKIGERLRNLRLKRGISGNRLAKQAGLSQSTISQAETDSKSPTINTLVMICKALDITIEDFFHMTEFRIPKTHVDLYKAIMALTPDQQDTLIHVIKHIKEKRGRSVSA